MLLWPIRLLSMKWRAKEPLDLISIYGIFLKILLIDEISETIDGFVPLWIEVEHYGCPSCAIDAYASVLGKKGKRSDHPGMVVVTPV